MLERYESMQSYKARIPVNVKKFYLNMQNLNS